MQGEQSRLPAAVAPPAVDSIGSAPQLRIIAPADFDGLAEQMRSIITEPREWLGLGRVTLTPLTLVLVHGSAGFARWSRGRVPGWGAGLSVPSQRLVVIRVNAGNPIQTLRHELAHIAFATRIRVRVPVWFNEGYAVLAAGEHGRLDALQLNLAVALGRIPSLEQLNLALRGSVADAGPAYALAGSAVADIARRHPTGTLRPMLERLEAGEMFAEALKRSTGYNPLDFSEAWRQDIRKQYNLFIWLITGGAWAVLALLLAALAISRRRRDAARRAALDIGWPLPPVDQIEFQLDDDSMTAPPSQADRLDQSGPDG